MFHSQTWLGPVASKLVGLWHFSAYECHPNEYWHHTLWKCDKQLIHRLNTLSCPVVCGMPDECSSRTCQAGNIVCSPPVFLPLSELTDYENAEGRNSHLYLRGTLTPLEIRAERNTLTLAGSDYTNSMSYGVIDQFNGFSTILRADLSPVFPPALLCFFSSKSAR